MRFQLVDAAKKEFPVQRLCKILGVSELVDEHGRVGESGVAQEVAEHGRLAAAEEPGEHVYRDPGVTT